MKLSRRTMLRGAAGGAAVSLGLPLLEAMLNNTGTALADGSDLPCRFMTFMFGNGVRLDRWVPATTGAGYTLTEELAPLSNVRDYCSVLSGFTSYLPGGNGHTNGMYASFSGHPGEYYDPDDALASRPGGPSVDHVVADTLGADTYLRTLQVGNSKRTPQGAAYTMSFRGPTRLNPPQLNPQSVYSRLFVGPGEGDDLRGRMLDAVADDARALKKRLGKPDKQRLDAHLQSVRDLEKRLTAIPPECTAPPMPTETNADVGGLEPLVEVAQVMADLLAVALSCDLTRVASFQQTGTVCQSVFYMTGAALENHAMSHEASPDSIDLIHEAVVVNMQAFAYLLETLAATPDGDGNLLDNTIVLLGTDVAEGLSHSPFDMPFIVAGRGGGRMRYPGVHVREEGRNTSDILYTVGRALVPDLESIGSAEGLSSQAVAAIEA